LGHRTFAPVLALLCLVALAACGSSSSSSGGGSSSGGSSSSAKGAPLVVGIVPPTSGSLQVFGAAIKDAWQLAVDQANAQGGVAGHEVKLVVGSTDSSPPATLSSARQLVLQDQAHFLGGVLSSPEIAALNPILPGLNAVLFNSTGKDNFLRGAQCSANTYNIIQSVSMDATAVGQVLHDFPAKKWAIIAEDYSSGHDLATDLTSAVKASGGSVVSTQFAPLGTTDFGSLISQISASGADGLFVGEYGGDGVAFVKQAEQYGLFKHIPTIIGFDTVNEAVFPILGNSVLGWYDAIEYVHQQNTGDNAQFASAFKAKYGTVPYFIGAENYVAAQTLFAAVKKANSIDPHQVMAALNGLTYNTIEGTVTMRAADHQMLSPSYVGLVVKQAGSPGGLGWKIIASKPPSVTTPSPNPACHL
jgi:branched-chain amino acid transport system substrate-binding protein